MSKDLRDVLRERARRQAEEQEASAAAESTAPADPARTGEDAAAHGGFVHTSPSDGSGRSGASDPAEDRAANRDTAADPYSAEDNPYSAEDSVLAPLRRPIVLAAMLFTFALGVYLRPIMVTEARAPEPSGAPGATLAELERLAGVGGAGTATLPSAAELEEATSELAAALLDPNNRVTIQVITYRDRASMVPYGEATVAHLVASGFRAMGPLRVGENLVVLAEAAPTATELAPLRDAIAALADPSGRPGEYATALVRNIEDFVERDDD